MHVNKCTAVTMRNQTLPGLDLSLPSQLDGNAVVTCCRSSRKLHITLSITACCDQTDSGRASHHHSSLPASKQSWPVTAHVPFVLARLLLLKYALSDQQLAAFHQQLGLICRLVLSLFCFDVPRAAQIAVICGCAVLFLDACFPCYTPNDPILWAACLPPPPTRGPIQGLFMHSTLSPTKPTGTARSSSWLVHCLVYLQQHKRSCV